MGSIPTWGTMENQNRVCAKCNRPSGSGRAEVRPYGPGGSLICFDCMMNGNEEECRREYERQSDLAGPNIVLTPDGPKRHPGGGSA